MRNCRCVSVSIKTIQFVQLLKINTYMHFWAHARSHPCTVHVLARAHSGFVPFIAYAAVHHTLFTKIKLHFVSIKFLVYIISYTHVNSLNLCDSALYVFCIT